MVSGLNLPVVVIFWDEKRYKLSCGDLAIPLLVLAVTCIFIGYWMIPLMSLPKHEVQNGWLNQVIKLNKHNTVSSRDSITTAESESWSFKLKVK